MTYIHRKIPIKLYLTANQDDESGKQPTLVPYSSTLGNGSDEPYTTVVNEVTIITETTTITTLTTTSGNNRLYNNFVNFVTGQFGLVLNF